MKRINSNRRLLYFYACSFFIFSASIFSAYSQKMQPDMKGKNASQQREMKVDKMVKGLIPQGIMMGEAKKWMIGYQVMFDNMKGNLVKTKSVTNASIVQNYMAAPIDMKMQMHMGMAMYAPSDKLTLMVMIPFIRKSMNHVMENGTRFNELTKGIGDIELRGIYNLSASKNLKNRVFINWGVALPTGSIDKQMGNMRLEYPMQLGSGSVAISPGITYLGQVKPWGWGAEFIPVFQTGKNKNGYRLGNTYKQNIWVLRQLTSWLSISAKANGEFWQNIKGADEMLDIMDEPTKIPALQGGKRLDFIFGMSIYPDKGFLKQSQFFIQALKPVLQSLNGPQLKKQSTIKLGWQFEF